MIVLHAVVTASFILTPNDAPEPVGSLVAYPTEVNLEGAGDRQRLLVFERSADGTWLDRTTEASLEVDAAVARLDGQRLRPVSDGTTSMRVTLPDGRGLEVPVSVRDAGIDRQMSLRLDVLPVLTSAGCNSGACHGSARGQDGFHLSLFGYDPAGDYQRITTERPGRRVDLAFPRSSLLLEKALASVPHTGGRLLAEEEEAFGTLLRWLEEGALDDGADVAEVTGIELYPPELVISGSGAELPLSVRARYSDGTDRDVTDLAVFRTSNEVTGALPDRGVLRAGEAGEAFITASFGVHTVGLPLVVLDAVESGSEWSDPAEGVVPSNWVDEFVEQKLRKLRVTPSSICSDEAYLRRVHLDVVGRLPEPEEREAFISDPRPSSEKRAALAEKLLSEKGFTEIWVMQWAELLGIRSSRDISEKAALLYFEWLRDRIARNAPVDAMVSDLLTASGGTFAAPETNFYQSERDNLVLSENVAQAFLGIRLKCAQCHNHPFDRWTQDDYYGFAAFFAQVGRKAAEDPREQVVFDRRRGEVNHPVDGRTVAPKFLGGETPSVQNVDRRAVLAGWLTAPENPWFARSLANRVWAHFMGPGIVEPVDDFQVSNPPSNGPLLDALAMRLVDTGYDFRDLVREILTSRAYQRSAEVTASNAGDSRNYSHATIRRMRAETLLDAICQVTDSPEKYRGLPLGSRAVEIADGTTGNYFLTTFGRSRRETVCACEVSFAPSLSQALHLLNGSTVHEKIRRGGLIKQMIADGIANEDVIRALYLRSLSRPPTEEELAALVTQVPADGDERRAALEDVFWALLNSREFLFLH